MQPLQGGGPVTKPMGRYLALMCSKCGKWRAVVKAETFTCHKCGKRLKQREVRRGGDYLTATEAVLAVQHLEANRSQEDEAREAIEWVRQREEEMRREVYHA